MKASHRLPGLLLAISLCVGTPVWSAETPDHAAHHPAPATTLPTPTGSPSEMGGMAVRGPKNGMMGGNMMAMMGSMMPMMSGMMSPYVEGNLAFIRTEIKISADQSAAWDRYADAYRSAANFMHSMQGSMMGSMQGDLPSRMAAHQKMMAAHLDALKSINGPLNALY